MASPIKQGDKRRNIPDLPQLQSNVGVEIPSGNEAVASRVAEFGNIMQNFGGRATQYANQQIGIKEKAEQMVLKTNIDNSMRAFATTSLNMLDPQAGIDSFHKQSDDYINKLLEGQTGVHADTIRAYALSSKSTNLRPLQTQLRSQARIGARTSLLASFDSNMKDLNQIINNTPYEEAINFHSFDPSNRDEALKSSPTIAKANYVTSQVLNQIDAGMQAGLLTAKEGEKLKKQYIENANDQMINHTYQMAIENGHGEEYLNIYASRFKGYEDAPKFAKKLLDFKKIQSLELAQQHISENTATQSIKDNFNNVAKGKPSNPMVDAMASNLATKYPDYSKQMRMYEMSGSFYGMMTSGNRASALELIGRLNEKAKELEAANPNDKDYQEEVIRTKQAIQLATKNAEEYFKEYDRDPPANIQKSGVLGSVATQQAIYQKALAQNALPEPLRTPMNKTIPSMVAYQVLHGGTAQGASVMSIPEAQGFANEIMKSDAVNAVAKIQSLNQQFGSYSSNAWQDLIKKGGLPRGYGVLQSMNPLSPYLQDTVDAIKHPESAYDSNQKMAIKKRVSDAMDFTSNRAHPNAGLFTRLIGTGWETLKEQVTGHEYDPGQYSTGLGGTPAIFSDKTTPPDTRIKAYAESITSTAGWNTGARLNDIKEHLNTMANYYRSVRNLSEDESMRRAIESLTGQYSFMDYKDNIIRLPRNQTNLNDVSQILTKTPDLLNKVDWQFPTLSQDYQKASRTDDVNYYLQDIKGGHWATHPTDSGLVWVGASGMIPRMKNGNPMFISFESMKSFNPERTYSTFFSAPERKEGESYAQQTARLNETSQVLDLLKSNNVVFNKERLGLDDTIPEHKKILDTFNRFETLTGIAHQNFNNLVDRYFSNHAAKTRKQLSEGKR
jgi:hypothetical protein